MEAIIVTIFVLGYAAIAMEHTIRINKAASALVTGVLCWVVYIVATPDKAFVNEQLAHHLGELSGILFFLMGAMTIVELVDAHDGFEIITSKITATNKRKLLWIVGAITFFLSAILDNLTTTIVMVSLLRKLIKDATNRLFFIGLVVVAANAGGAWSPIGDVTTTMLWMNGQITTSAVIMQVLLPSLVCLATPLLYLSYRLRGKVERPVITKSNNGAISLQHQLIILFTGLLVLLMVPVFKTLTHLPPYMGVLIGLGLLWIITEMLHGDKDVEDKHNLSVVYALRKIDTPSILFFLGILVSIAALESSGILPAMAGWLNDHAPNAHVITASVGLLSSIVDNVPLVAALQGMYGLDQFPVDHPFWLELAYTTGTGGSVLIIGSAAGVAAMGMEHISFAWYLKKITFLALLGYFAGFATFLLQQFFSGGL